MATVKFNVNHEVRVKLTEHGLKILKQQHDELFMRAMRAPIWQPPAVDAEGYSKFQLHDLMYTFGECMLLGNSILPFETEILLEAPD